jgi:hypothetical protein
MAVRSATELLLSLLLRVDGKLSAPLLLSGPPREEVVRKAIVFDLSSAIKFRSARISPFSFSASLLILMNCVLFWYTFCCRSTDVRLRIFCKVC